MWKHNVKNIEELDNAIMLPLKDQELLVVDKGTASKLGIPGLLCVNEYYTTKEGSDVVSLVRSLDTVSE